MIKIVFSAYLLCVCVLLYTPSVHFIQYYNKKLSVSQKGFLNVKMEMFKNLKKENSDGKNSKRKVLKNVR